MESKCFECIGRPICARDNPMHGERCKKFHSVLESKLQSASPNNKASPKLPEFELVETRFTKLEENNERCRC